MQADFDVVQDTLRRLLPECETENATSLRLRARKTFAVQGLSSDIALVLQSGCGLVTEKWLCEGSFISTVLYPSDTLVLLRSAPVERPSLMALTDMSLVRASLPGPANGPTHVAGSVVRALALQNERLKLHTAILSRAGTKERVASLLIELGVRLGSATPGGMVVDVPLSRDEIASYLAINPDTLSRTMSELKSDGIISKIDRKRLIIRDWQTLLNASRFGTAIASLHKAPGNPRAV